jgi:integrase
MRLRVTKSLFRSALRDAFITEDPSVSIKAVKHAHADVRRRPFTLPEIQMVLKAADPEWRSMIVFGLYTGQRIGDLSVLTWANVDLDRGMICLKAAKTGKALTIPIAAPLLAHIRSLPVRSDRAAPVHPRAYRVMVTQRTPSNLCIEFAKVLKRAGLRPNGTRRVIRRTNYELSFHSLRHAFVSLLKDAGAPEAAVMEQAGHSSKEMSAHYTHTGLDALERAVRLLPEVAA